jgi:5-hydroxyisourate hydrolase / 2-oxo-4-hydroxy-4-carboxy-5-ureidoimidazoline decarboxylase
MATCHERHPDFFPAIPFYPKVSVFFQITEAQTREHFHVPLTWNPYGYSTYRGS